MSYSRGTGAGGVSASRGLVDRGSAGAAKNQRYHWYPAKRERRGGDILSAALAGAAGTSTGRLGDEVVLNDLLGTNKCHEHNVQE